MLFVPSTRGFVGKGVPVSSFSFATPPLALAGDTRIQVSSPVANVPGSGASASATGGNSPQVSANGSTWGNLATINPGGTIYARADASNSWNTPSTTTVTVGLGSASFTITTATIPTYNVSVYNVASGLPGSNYSTPNVSTGSNYPGIPSVGSAGSISGTPSAFQVSATARSGFGQVQSVTVSLGSYSSTWTITNVPAPSMSLGSANIHGASPGAGPYGNLLTVSGMVAGLSYTLDATGGGNPRFSRNQITYTSTLTLTSADNGNPVTLGVMAPNSTGQTNTATVTISCGSASATGPSWSVST